MAGAPLSYEDVLQQLEELRQQYDAVVKERDDLRKKVTAGV